MSRPQQQQGQKTSTSTSTSAPKPTQPTPPGPGDWKKQLALPAKDVRPQTEVSSFSFLSLSLPCGSAARRCEGATPLQQRPARRGQGWKQGMREQAAGLSRVEETSRGARWSWSRITDAGLARCCVRWSVSSSARARREWCVGRRAWACERLSGWRRVSYSGTVVRGSAADVVCLLPALTYNNRTSPLRRAMSSRVSDLERSER